MAVEAPQGTIRQVEWGGITIELGSFHQEIDPGPLFSRLPDDRCQCPPWGYVLRGQIRFKFADHEEVYNAGDVYYDAFSAALTYALTHVGGIAGIRAMGGFPVPAGY